MGSYYAVPVRRENRTLTYNPLDGHCALALTPMDAVIQLGMPKAGTMIAVWPLTQKVSLEEAGRVCSLMAPLRIFIVVDQEEGVMFPLGLDPALDAVMEVPGAGRD
jgi:hypothetical protein